MKLELHRICPVVLALLIWAGCEKQAPAPAGADAAAAPPAKLPEGFFLAAAPADAVELAAAKQAAKAGDAVVVHGRIGGGKDPFVESRAMFTLADMSMKTCSERHGDGCTTPWDYCCEPGENVIANTATVQVVDADGRPLKLGLNGVGGLKPASELIVRGKVSQKPDEKTLVIDAVAVYVKP